MNYRDIEIDGMKELLKENELEIARLRKENKNLKLTLEHMENTCKDYLNDRDTLREENRNLKERIDVLYEFIERNDKLVDEVIDEEDLDKLNRYIYIDDDLVDRTLESKD